MKDFITSYFEFISDDALQSLDIKVVGKWRKYFQLKCEFYKAYVSLIQCVNFTRLT